MNFDFRILHQLHFKSVDYVENTKLTLWTQCLMSLRPFISTFKTKAMSLHRVQFHIRMALSRSLKRLRRWNVLLLCFWIQHHCLLIIVVIPHITNVVIDHRFLLFCFHLRCSTQDLTKRTRLHLQHRSNVIRKTLRFLHSNHLLHLLTQPNIENPLQMVII